MASLILILASLLALVSAVFSKLLADEFKAWRPRIVSRIIALAVCNLPIVKRERFSEEWEGFVNDIPGDISKLLAAFGCLFASCKIANHLSEFRERVFDVVIASAALISLAPLLVFVSLCIKLNSAGPIIFRRVRVGRNGKSFSSYKFRTMHVGMSEPTQTAMGKWLSKSYLDELPQIFNVLKGEMSLIGPRPLDLSDIVSVEYKKSRPGLMGLWTFDPAESHAAQPQSLALLLKLIIAFIGAAALGGPYPLETAYRVGLIVSAGFMLFSLLVILR